MKTGTSLYLDAVRFMAAFAVFMSHYATQHFTGGLFWQLMPYGAEAVIVFFVLSGFVIGYVTDSREGDPRSYAVNRAARIWSVALPALLLTLLLDTAGSALRPDLYSPAALIHYQADGQVWGYLASALFLNQLWYLDLTPGTDLPYWSLGYEVWYYVIFGVAVFMPRAARLPATLVVAAIAGPRILALLPLWLAGVACYRLTRAGRQSVPVGAVCLTVSVAGWVAHEAWAFRYGRLYGLGPDVFGRLQLVQDYIVGGLFALHLIGVCHLSDVIARLLGPVARPVRWLAGATFSLYLVHYPVMQIIVAAIPWPPAATITRVLLFVLTLAAVFLFAELAERRKEAWRRMIWAVSLRLFPPAPALAPDVIGRSS
jgi:peptidoglycan/LPS O-acetylase OafA/YrhL